MKSGIWVVWEKIKAITPFDDREVRGHKRDWFVQAREGRRCGYWGEGVVPTASPGVGTVEVASRLAAVNQYG